VDDLVNPLPAVLDPPSVEAAHALERLTEDVHRDLDRLAYPAPVWVRPRPHGSGQHVYDVVIVGGGQSGLTVGFGLLREKVDNILIIDENPEGLEGPWITYARMVTLRTPKYLTGPDQGLPSLTCRAWWEAQFGAASWERLDKIPRGEWARYLHWFRKT
jgi:cation diffusion facilitator CzcD-associated flavoprotein CzcO